MSLGTAYHIEQTQEFLVLTCKGLIYAKWLAKELLSTNLQGNIERGTDASATNVCIARIGAHLQYFCVLLNSCHGHCVNPVH